MLSTNECGLYRNRIVQFFSKEVIVMNELILKLVAFCAMVLDHIASVNLDNIFLTFSDKSYEIARTIGRIAYPIYAFCLVEGFRHSHNIRQYGSRLLIWGIISQIPYAFTLNRTYLKPNFGELFALSPITAFRYLNILFTLFIGLVALVFIHKKPLAQTFRSCNFIWVLLICSCFAFYVSKMDSNSYLVLFSAIIIIFLTLVTIILQVLHKHLIVRDLLARYILIFFIVMIFDLYPQLRLRCRLDYGIWGIMLILCLSYATKPWISSLMIFLWGIFFYSSTGTPDTLSIIGTAFASILILPYNGKRSSKPHPQLDKIFYVAYPLHLLIIWICILYFYGSLPQIQFIRYYLSDNKF